MVLVSDTEQGFAGVFIYMCWPLAGASVLL